MKSSESKKQPSHLTQSSASMHKKRCHSSLSLMTYSTRMEGSGHMSEFFAGFPSTFSITRTRRAKLSGKVQKLTQMSWAWSISFILESWLSVATNVTTCWTFWRSSLCWKGVIWLGSRRVWPRLSRVWHALVNWMRLWLSSRGPFRLITCRGYSRVMEVKMVMVGVSHNSSREWTF